MADVKTEMTSEFRSQILKAIAAGVVAIVAAIAAAAWAVIVTLPDRVGLVPERTVATFDRTGCPPGWEEYQEGWGRFVIGAVAEEKLGIIPGDFRVDARGVNLLERELGRPGGSQSHQLTLDEIPSHDHGGATGSGSTGTFMQYPAQGDTAGRIHGDVPFSIADHSHSISAQGGGQPHDNMPPYVALTMCRKL